MKHLIKLSFIVLLLLGCKKNETKQKTEVKKEPATIITKDYELHIPYKQNGILILFAGGGATAKDTETEFKITQPALQKNIAVLLMNFNGKLWIEDKDSKALTQLLNDTFKKHNLNTENVVIGGMSIGGNVTLTLTNYLLENNTLFKPKGAFIVDSPIDLYGLYESSIKDTKNPDFSEERLAEPKWIINYFNEEFGGSDAVLTNIQNVSPFTLKTNHIKNIKNLKNIQFNLYTEPDKTWWKDVRNTDFESTNAYSIQQLFKVLKANNWNKVNLVETENKGYRANGERNPHSWSIVDKNEMLNQLFNKNENKLGIDYHIHNPSKETAGYMQTFGDTIKTQSIEELEKSLNDTLINRAVIMSMAYLVSMKELKLDNETQKELTRKENYFTVNQALQSDKIYAFFSVNPLTDFALEEAKYWINHKGVSGLKLHLANSRFDFFNSNHIKKLQALLKVVDKKGMNIFIHMRNRNPDYGPKDADIFIKEIIPYAPKSNWIIAHAGGWGLYDETTEKVLSKFIDLIKSNQINKERIYIEIGAVVLPSKLKKKYQMAEKVLIEQESKFIQKFRTLDRKYWLFGSDWLPNETVPSNEYFNELIKAGFNKEELLDIVDNKLHFVK